MDSQATHHVTCPCCKGKKRVPVVEHDEVEGRTVLTYPICCHCQGRGTVPSETPEAPLGVMGQIVPPDEGLDTEDGHW